MKSFLITYDNKWPRDYSRVYQLMAEWKAVRLAESVWLANLRGPAPTIRDIVLSKMQLNDGVAVVELRPGADWAVSNAINPAAKHWLSGWVTPSQAAAAA